MGGSEATRRVEYEAGVRRAQGILAVVPDQIGRGQRAPDRIGEAVVVLAGVRADDEEPSRGGRECGPGGWPRGVGGPRRVGRPRRGGRPRGVGGPWRIGRLWRARRTW